MLRKLFILISLALYISACTTTPVNAAPNKSVENPPPHPQLKSDASASPAKRHKFTTWKSDFIQETISKGYDAQLVKAVISPAKINDRALDRDKKQPEFTKPIWTYVKNAASQTRIKNGQAELSEHRAEFDQIAARYPVDRHVLTAIWGMESAYGKFQGDHNIIDSYATFAFDGRRQEFGRTQLYAILDMLSDKTVRHSQLIGSWAGAMGMTQFIPATMRDYAVDFDGNGNIDLWQSELDALGSAANYLTRHGWDKTSPVITEIALPDGFDYGLSDGRKMSIAQWNALGVRDKNGRNWSAQAQALEARLLIPAGHKGPKFLAFKNFDVIMKYNKSTSYALGISNLAQSFQGQTLIHTDWPRADKPLSRTNKKALQTRLTALGYETGGVDGRIGPNTRKAIRAWQTSQGLPADGYMNQTLFKRLMAR